MRVAIYGAGAMGTILGAYIAASGKQIDLITRNTGHVEAIKEHGARVLGNANFTVRVNALTPDVGRIRYYFPYDQTARKS